MYAQNIIKRGVVFAAVSMAWPMFVAMSSFLLPDGILARVERIGHIKSVYTTSFWCMIFLAPALLPLLQKLIPQLGLRLTKGISILLYAYTGLVTLACLNQIFFFPKLIGKYWVSFASKWYMGNPHSLPYLFHQLAYGCLGIALVTLLAKHVSRFSGHQKKIAICLLSAAALFIAGALSLIVQRPEGLLFTYTGMLLLIPFAFFTVAYGMAVYQQKV